MCEHEQLALIPFTPAVDSPRLSVPVAPLLYLHRLERRYHLRGRAATAYHAGALGMMLFLALTPGFGAQYLVAVLPLIFAANIRLAALYGLTAYATLIIGTWKFLTARAANPPAEAAKIIN